MLKGNFNAFTHNYWHYTWPTSLIVRNVPSDAPTSLPCITCREPTNDIIKCIRNLLKLDFFCTPTSRTSQVIRNTHRSQFCSWESCWNFQQMFNSRHHSMHCPTNKDDGISRARSVLYFWIRFLHSLLITTSVNNYQRGPLTSTTLAVHVREMCSGNWGFFSILSNFLPR